MVAYPNPPADEIHFARLNGSERQLGDLWEAAKVAEVRPATIRVWVSRGKIEPILDDENGIYYHLPTVKKAAEGGKKHRPPNPAANSRRQQAHAA